MVRFLGQAATMERTMPRGTAEATAPCMGPRGWRREPIPSNVAFHVRIGRRNHHQTKA